MMSESMVEELERFIRVRFADILEEGELAILHEQGGLEKLKARLVERSSRLRRERRSGMRV